jgi:hypothetical protein
VTDFSTAGEPVAEGTDLSAAPLDTAAPDATPNPGGAAPAPEATAPEPDEAAPEEAAPELPEGTLPAPIGTGFPPAATGDDTTNAEGTVVTDTGTATFPQPMEPASAGHVNLATVPPMGSLIIPADTEGGETVTIDVYGTEVDDATAERAYAAARTAGFSLREL